MSRTFLWQFLPAFCILGGAVIAAVGGFWQSWRQSNFTGEIRQKNEEIIRLQREAASAVTGGDSFCYMVLQMADTTAMQVGPMFVHVGRYPLYDVEARLVDVDEHRRLTEAHDPSAINALVGTSMRVGNMTPGLARGPVAALQHPSGRKISFNVFLSGRNGWFSNFGNVGWVTVGPLQIR
jgi:hypothetical protein